VDKEKTMDLLDCQRLDEIIERHKEEKGALVSILNEIQEQENYVSEGVINYLSEKLCIPASQIFGVASYYSAFSIQPWGRHAIKVCDGTSCHLKGGSYLLTRLERELKVAERGTTEDLKFTLEKVRCQGYCHVGPAVKIDDTVHGPVTQEKALKLIEEQK
jgi:NADH:ubiquinone oxidoreductase subunit E